MIGPCHGPGPGSIPGERSLYASVCCCLLVAHLRLALLCTVDEAKLVLEHTVKLSDVSDPTFYDAIFVPGGHGPMFDLAESDLLGGILTKAAAAGKIIAAVCHGPAGLAKAKGSDGLPLLNDRQVTGFTNSEEEAVGKTKMVNFLLEDKLKELGGKLVRKPDWQPCVVTDGNLITGQNPASARGVGETLLQQLKEKRTAMGGVASGGVTFSAAEAGLVGDKKGAAAQDMSPAGLAS
ncbi:class I glutamine amidotransferase-like protein [Scenedesmus sp. NREL 46B-D3]|nr:class I glutamine amidotransferase-like protein [Scenedesmus sp. NREL 46B-D3]